MMGKQASSIRPSQTMPQLYYTREDIQEQYLSTSRARQQDSAANSGKRQPQRQQNNKRSPLSTTSGAAQNAAGAGSKRARSSDPRRGELEPGASCSSSGDEDESTSENQATVEGYPRGRRARRSTGDRKRRRRAHSASLFSACFQIPNLGSMLPSASSSSSSGNAGHSRRRSFLSHLGLKGQHKQPPGQAQQRPISSSQTMSSLRQVSSGLGAKNDDPSAVGMNSPASAHGSTRKHVSFGGQQRQQQPPRQAQDQTQADQTAPMSPAGAAAPVRTQPQQQQPSNNVIMKNYQAPQQQQQGRQTTSGRGPIEAQAEDPTSQMAKQSASSAIYLVNSQVTNSPPMGPRASSSSSSPPPPPQVIYHNYPAVLRQHQNQQPQRSQTFIGPQQQQQQQMHSSVMSQVPPTPQAPCPPYARPPTTVYKRLPAVPMRTQATQTEITAYHLMGTPPLSSSSSAAGRRAQRQQQHSSQQTATDSPSSSATVAPPSANQTPVRPMDSVSASLIGGPTIAQVIYDFPGGGTNLKQAAADAAAAASADQRSKPGDERRAESIEPSLGAPQASRFARSPEHVPASSLPADDEDDGSDEWSVDEEEEEEEPEQKEELAKRGAQVRVGGSASGEEARPEVGASNEAARPSENDGDDDDDEVECGNLKASALLSGSSFSSSSCSSSAASLEGHDSTLAALQLTSEPPKRPEAGSAAPMSSAPSSSTRQQQQHHHHQPAGDNNETIRRAREEAGASIMRNDNDDAAGRLPGPAGSGLKNDNMPVGVSQQPPQRQASRGSDREPPPPSQLGLAAAAAPDIEPPSQFKDTSGRTCHSGAALGDSQLLAIGSGSSELLGELPDSGSFQLDRAPSPPSLSEASSQTEPSMAQHIMDLGQSLTRSRQFVATRNSKLAASGNSSLSTDDFSLRLESAPPQATRLDGNHDEFSPAQVQRTLGQQLGAEAGRAGPEPLPAPSMTPGQAVPPEEPGDGMQMGERGNDDDGNLASPSSLDADYAAQGDYHNMETRPSGRVAGQDVIVDIGAGDGAKQDDEDDEELASDLLLLRQRESIRRPTGNRKPRASPAEQRRDHFLTLSSGEQAADEEPAAATTTTSTTATTTRQRPSTSTLSTRHHSYCSTDDFNSGPASSQLIEAQLAFQLELHEHGPGGSSLAARSAQPAAAARRSDELEEIDESADNLAPAAVVSPGGASSGSDSGTRDAASGRVSSAASGLDAPLVGRREEPEGESVAQDDGRDAAAASPLGSLNLGSPSLAAHSGPANGADKANYHNYCSEQTIRADCDGAAFMAPGAHLDEAHKSLPQRQTSSASSASEAAALARSAPDRKATAGGASAEEEEERGPEEVNSRPNQTDVAESARDEPTQVAHCVSPPRRLLEAGGRKSSASPPTTVSELDQDEELSTPSFVDSYRNRLQEACQVADSVLGQLMGECLEPAGEQQQQQFGRRQSASQSLIARQLAAGEPDAGVSMESSSNSGTLSSTTSVSGRSYACCHPKGAQEKPQAARPKPPKKPAHLRAKVRSPEQEEEAAREEERRQLVGELQKPAEKAAALALATTSVARAAAALQEQQQQHQAKAALEGPQGDQAQEPPAVASGNSNKELEEQQSEANLGSRIGPEAGELSPPDDEPNKGHPEEQDGSGSIRASGGDERPPGASSVESERAARSSTGAAASGNSVDSPSEPRNSSASFESYPALVSRSGSVSSAVSVIQTSGGHQLSRDGQDSPCQEPRTLEGDEPALVEPPSPQSTGEKSSRSSGTGSSSRDGSSSAASDSRQATQGSGPSCASFTCAEFPADQQQAPVEEERQPQASPAHREAAADDQLGGPSELAPVRRLSQELSTVSEVSEGELSLGPASLANSAQQTPLRNQGRPTGAAANGSAESAGEQERRQEAPEARGAAEVAPLGAELSQMGDPATDQDLAHSEYTLRSQASEAAILTAGSSEALEDYNAAGSRQQPASGPTDPTSAPAAQTAELARLALLEQRRRSSSSAKIPSAVIKAVGVDCPYVPDILPLSPPPPPSLSPSPVAGSSQLQATHHRRLSHDDTMEAIEDDVEGEEQELQQQQLERQKQQRQQVIPEPPPAFATCSEEQRACTPAESILEEDEEREDSEDDGGPDEDEESSISVSQHGVVVSQEVPSPMASGRRGTLKRSPQHSNGRHSNSSSRSLTPSHAANSPVAQPALTPTEKMANKGNIDPPPVDPESDRPPEEWEPPAEGNNRPLAACSKPQSSDSTTQVILEHLSRHQPDSLLEEPAPALEQHASHLVEMEGASSSTGTMKRKVKVGTRDDSLAEHSAQRSLAADEQDQQQPSSLPADLRQPQRTTYKRGPTLAQMKNSEREQHGQQQQQQQPPAASVGSLATDTSICSSCSCLEASFDLPAQEAEQARAGAQPTDGREESEQPPTPPTVAAVPTLAQLQSSGGSWMSQEEGTVFTENYWLSHWLYISEHEESEIWRQAIDMSNSSPTQHHTAPASERSPEAELEPEEDGQAAGDQQVAPGMPRNMPEVSSTKSEKSFSSKYKSTTRKMIHRRATIEMYKRIMNNNLKREKRVEISRANGEFGFRIHGSRPVVVSAIERGTSAETCGLQVGDLIYAINGTNILDMAHSDVVKLAHSADSSSLVLDLVPTNDFLRMSKYNRSSNKRYEPTVTGYLMRLSPSTAQPLLVDLQDQMSRAPGISSQQRASKLNEVMRFAWRKRYFVLRSDNCLYWYRSPTAIEPYGGINLQGFSASLTNEFSEPNYVIRLVKYGSQPHYLGTNNICDIQTWIDSINKAATEANQNDPYMKRTLTMARTKPSQIPEPDCSGYLYKFSHKRSGGAHWRAAYFVLKDACLYLFRDQQADTVSQASAVYYLHGYRVRNKHIEHKKHTFELIPPNRKTIRPMFLMASSEIDRRRWIAALEYSIERWIEID